MAVTAHIFWKGAEQSVAELVFAYPLREGDQFVFRIEDDTLVCTVSLVTHYPVSAASEATPSVAYYLTRTPLSKIRTRWWMAKQMLIGAARETLKLK
jgi:hypothetical protein